MSILNKKRSKYDNTPPDWVFEEVQSKCIAYWKNNFSDEHGYVTGKVERIIGMANYKDNFLFMLNMFDSNHGRRCIDTIIEPVREWIYKAKVAKGYLM